MDAAGCWCTLVAAEHRCTTPHNSSVLQCYRSRWMLQAAGALLSSHSIAALPHTTAQYWRTLVAAEHRCTTPHNSSVLAHACRRRASRHHPTQQLSLEVVCLRDIGAAGLEYWSLNLTSPFHVVVSHCAHTTRAIHHQRYWVCGDPPQRTMEFRTYLCDDTFLQFGEMTSTVCLMCLLKLLLVYLGSAIIISFWGDEPLVPVLGETIEPQHSSIKNMSWWTDKNILYHLYLYLHKCLAAVPSSNRICWRNKSVKLFKIHKTINVIIQ